MPAGNDYSTNATVITAGGGGGVNKPNGLIEAISEIQQYYVIEGQGQEIPAEFLTLEGTLNFFKIGASSGLKDGLFVLLLFPIFVFYLLPFVFNHQPSLIVKFTMNSIPYFPLLINTGMCIYISQYYVGNLTRRAINSLFVGRSIMLIVKAGLIYIAYYILFELSTPKNVWAVAQHFKNPEKFYYDYLTILPKMVPVAAHCAIIICVASIIPYGSVYILDFWRRMKIKKNQKVIGG